MCGIPVDLQTNKLSTDDGWERITRREAERLNDEVRKA